MTGTAFVGRREELARVAGVLRGDPGAVSTMLLTGDAGIGKTRLLTEAVRATPEVLVLTGGCLPMSEPLPYGAITDAFSGLIGPSARATLDRAFARCAPYVRPQMAALIPALSDENRLTSVGAADRPRLFAAVRDLLGALGAERRTVLAIEDLHWADAGILDLLTYLTRAVNRQAVGLMVTVRREELAAAQPVSDWVSAAQRLRDTLTVDLAPLERGEIGEMVRNLLGEQPHPAFLTEVLQRGQGSPLFTEHLVAAAIGQGSTVEGDTRLPGELASLFASRIRSVGQEGRAVLATLAVAARALDESELVPAPGAPARLGPVLRQLSDARLVTGPDLAGRYRLTHAMLEEAVRSELLPSESAALHQHLAEVLAAREDPAVAGEIAAHWAFSGDRQQELLWTIRAAEHDETLAAWREAGMAWERVLKLWSPHDSTALASELEWGEAVVRCVDALTRGGREEDAEQLAQQALRSSVDPDDFTRARLLARLGWQRTIWDHAQGTAMLAESIELFAQVGASAERARALHRLSTCAEVAGDTRTAARLLRLAAEQAAASGARDQALVIATDMANEQLSQGDSDAALAALYRCWAETRELAVGSTGLLLPAVSLSDALLVLGRFEACVAEVLAAKAKLEEHGLQEAFGYAVLLVNGVEALLHLGQVAQAKDLLPRALPRRSTSCWPLYLAHATIDVRAGQLVEAERRLNEGAAVGFRSLLGRWILCEIGCGVRLSCSDPWEAWETAATELPTLVDSGYRQRLDLVLTLAAQAAADIAAGQRSPHPAVGQLRAWAQAAGCYNRGSQFRPAAARAMQFDAELARAQLSDDETMWAATATAWADLDCPHDQAYARYRRAEALLEQRRAKAAAAELRQAAALAVGHVPLTRQITALALRARIDLSTTVPRSSVPDAPASAVTAAARFGLTPREMSVLELLSFGKTNPQIGAALYMSPKTASVHVSSIMRKLQVTSRVQAAAVAERLGLLEEQRSRAGGASRL